MDNVIDHSSLINSRIEESMAVKRDLLAQSSSIVAAASILLDAYRSGRKMLVFGNGGSAADAQHIVAELAGRFLLERRGLPAVALTVNSSALTAIGNDYGYDYVFSRQIEGLGQPGDVALGLSTSGNSENVVQAVLCAKEIGLSTIGLTGEDGGALGKLVDCCIRVPSRDVPRVQECHILIGHILCEIIEKELYKP